MGRRYGGMFQGAKTVSVTDAGFVAIKYLFQGLDSGSFTKPVFTVGISDRGIFGHCGESNPQIWGVWGEGWYSTLT